MKLSECEILPGEIIEVEDPKHIGRVKASVPTWFDSSVMDKEALPWIYPFGMCGYQRFSKMEKGRKIWVLHNHENDLEYWYWPMFEEIDITKPIIDKYDSTEVLLGRSTGDSGSVLIYYNNSEGLVFKVGKTKVIINSNGEVNISDSTNAITINGNGISIGNNLSQSDSSQSDSGQSMVLGNKLTGILKDFAKHIHNAANGLQKDTKASATTIASFHNASKCFEKDIDQILSETSKIY